MNPELCGQVVRALPIASIQTHAVVAGEQIYFPTRLTLDDPSSAHMEDLSKQPPGRINFDPSFQYVSLNYGHISEAVPAWPIAQVFEQDLSALPALGKRVWHNLLHEDHALRVIVSFDGASNREEPLPREFAAPPEGISPPALVSFLLEEIDRIWLTEPRDCRDLRKGHAKTDAGVGGQYFSPWVMVTGVIRSLAVVELAALRRISLDEKIQVAHLSNFLSELLRAPAGVIGYFGLPELGAVVSAARAACPHFAVRTEFQTFLTVFATYLNRYNLWLHQGFPWRLGEHFQKE